ncbi:hypothetical protein K438DRAFT_1782436 [Mycena galopus ATCC 62051]|nr:hypothetical protein K438DRAFT_1782436 [Mycena galopus ATCC 62051]
MWLCSISRPCTLLCVYTAHASWPQIARCLPLGNPGYESQANCLCGAKTPLEGRMPHCGALVPPALAIRQPTDSLQVINMFDNFLLSLSNYSPSASFASLPISRLSQPLGVVADENGRIRAPPMRGCLYPRDFAACAEECSHLKAKMVVFVRPLRGAALYLFLEPTARDFTITKHENGCIPCAPRPSTWLASILREDFTAEEQHRRIRLLKQNANDEHGVPTVLPPRKRGGHALRRRRRSVRGQEDARLGDERRAREEAEQSAAEGRAHLEGQRRIAQKTRRAQKRPPSLRKRHRRLYGSLMYLVSVQCTTVSPV